MSNKISAAIIGYGNIGRAVHQSLLSAEDFCLTAVVTSSSLELPGVCIVKEVEQLPAVDVAIIAAPSRAVPDIAKKLLAKGIHCVDAYDIHSNIVSYRREADAIAKQHGACAVVAAGWDPGTDSILRALFLCMAPTGLTFTNFGPGMSMGHTVCVRGKEGVKDALSMTMPVGEGIHRRMVYVELSEGADLEQVTHSIQTDPYFIKDETHVIPVDCVAALKDMGHGVHMTRKGVSGSAQNQLFSYDMRIDNPALTAQVLVGVARATTKMAPGAYTMIEIPPIDMLPGDREQLIHDLV